MKKRVLIAAALCVGMLYGNGIITPAYAGHWQFKPNPYIDVNGNPPDPPSPDYTHYLYEKGLRASGWIGVDDRIIATEFADGISGAYAKIDLGEGG